LVLLYYFTYNDDAQSNTNQVGKHALNIFKMFVYVKIMNTDDALQVQSVYVGIQFKLPVYSRVCTCDSLYISLHM